MLSPGGTTSIIITALLLALQALACGLPARASAAAPKAQDQPRESVERAAPGAGSPKSGAAIRELLVVGLTLRGSDPWQKTLRAP